MLAQFDSFGNFEIPQITLCNPDGRALGILSNLSDRKMNIRFNDLSDLSFTIRRGAEDCRCPVYEQVEPFRYLLLEDIGYFIITDVSESEEGGEAYKTVEASSCEYELNNIQLDYYEGTYGFYSSAPQEKTDSLMTLIMEKLPSWRLDTGSIPSDVAARFRTFDTTDQTVYSFFMTEMEEAYECLFEFDILERVIRVYDRYQYDNRTDICLSTEDVLKGLTLRTKSDEIKTALTVKGGNGLDILSVNPLGTNMIYNFSYYATPDWMDDALIAKVQKWQADVAAFAEEETGVFPQKRAQINAIQSRKADKEGEITRLKQDLTNLQTQQSAIISEPAEQAQKNANLASVRTKINAAKSALSSAESALASIEAELKAANAGLKALQDQISLNAVFTPAEMEVLSRFIQQGAYTEENITRQDNMSYEEVQAQAQELYKKAQSLLNTISTPRYEYSVETGSFIFQKEFSHLTNQLHSGCLIDIRLAEDDIASLLLLEMAVDYDGKGLSLTFGNRYKLSDPSALFNDLVGGSVAKTASTVEYLRNTFDFKQQRDEIDKLAKLKDESINLTHNMVVNADNQVMVIDASGISGRRAVVDAEFNPTGEFDPEVLKITNNAIAFSTDDFQTTETVLGKNLLPDGVTTPDGKNYLYGLNAKLLMGDLIIGEKLKVSGEIEGRLINAKGLTVNNGTTDTLRVDENGDVSLNVKSLSITGNQVATQGDINNLKIGGRNYIRNSDKSFTNQSREFVQTYDLAPIFDTYGLSAWTLSFDLKCTKNHWVKVYCQNGSDLRYDIGDHLIQATTSFQRYSFSFIPYVYMPDVVKSILAFYSEYDSGAFVTVKNIKLEKGTKATDWTPAPEDPIGGKNLLLNTGKMTTTSYWGCSKETGVASVALADTDRGKAIAFQRGADCTGWFFCGNSSLGSKGFKFTPGDNYTLSFWAKTNRTPCTLSQRFCDGNATNQSIWFPSMELSTGWQKYTATATATAAGNNNFLYFTFDVNRFVYITDVKLEIGSKATDWTPAPEDRAYLVNTLSPTQADGMWLGSDGKLNITATQIKAGKLQSKDGSSYFDLENGKIVGKNAEITGSFQALSPNYTSSEGSSVTISGFTQSGSSFNCAGLQFRNAKNTLYGDVWGMDLGSYGASVGMECNGASISVSKDSYGKNINMQGDYITLNVGNYLYHTGTIQCGEILVPNGSLSGSVYTGEETINFSPAFSKAPRVVVAARTGGPYNVNASLGGNPTANSAKVIVQRNSKTADGYTAVQWIAVEPR